MMLRLRTGVHYCIANGRVVLLDCRQNLFLCLSPGSDLAFQDLLAGNFQDDYDQYFAELIDKGILIRGTGSEPIGRDIVPVPQSSALDTLGAAFSPLYFASAMMSHIRTSRQLKSMPFETLMIRIRQRKHSDSHHDDPIAFTNVRRSLSTFMATKRMVSSYEQCLHWSLSLVDFLSRNNFYPTLVIGVKMKPFSAHAWVQHNDIVLNDSLDNILAYTPIMAI